VDVESAVRPRKVRLGAPLEFARGIITTAGDEHPDLFLRNGNSVDLLKKERPRTKGEGGGGTLLS